MEHVLQPCVSSVTELRPEHGWMHSKREHLAPCSWAPWPISSPVSLGLSIRAVCKEHAECRCIGKEVRNIAQAADCRIIDDRMEVVVMKSVLSRVCVCEANQKQRANVRRCDAADIFDANFPPIPRKLYNGLHLQKIICIWTGDFVSTSGSYICAFSVLNQATGSGTVSSAPSELSRDILSALSPACS
jgi:hypothetical protein